MDIVYSDHAKKRMKRRGIEDWEVEHVLKHPIYVKKSFEVGKRLLGILEIEILK